MPERRFARRRESAEQRATWLELFYDLVFVFAVTELSHHLLNDLTWRGAGQSALLLLVVWWSWNYTTWVTNELDPDSFVVRLLMIGLMLASLLMSIAIPEAFGPRALLFVGSYLAIQIGRHAFLTFAAAGPGTLERERAGRILIWFAAAGVFWVAGAVAGGTARVVLWLVALALDYGAPVVVFYVPGRKRLEDNAWQVETSHFSERFALFVIIALGESIVVTGATTSDLALSFTRVLALAIAFLGSAALWWLYFARVVQVAQQELERAEHRTTVARDAYTYLHVVLVAGIIVTAVGDELVIAHPRDSLTHAEVAAVVAGPAIYLLAHTLIRLRLIGSVNPRRLGGAAACAVVGLAAASAPALVLGGLVLLVLIAVVGLDQLAAARRA
ncbi:MAG TPA: low temperature requirement protein A [Gaiellaceae bacterium]|jgi:low temperature requirement protein LtrA